MSLINHRMMLVQKDILGLVTGTSKPMNQIATTMGNFTIEARESRRITQDNWTADKQPKLLAERWKSMLNTLLKICEVWDQYMLPLLYL